MGKAKNITISESCGKWFASIQTEFEVVERPHPSASAVGVDVGVANFATLSDGVVFAPVDSFRRKQIKLAKLQRSLSRKVKFSQNWKKQKAKIGKLHQTIANTRRDFLHQTSTTISKHHALIVIEDLKVKNMSKSAAGSLDAPGNNVSAKSGLNKAILDQGWFEFRRQLEYKQAWRGGEVLAVNPRNTSRTCLCCGHVSADNRASQSKFNCVNCGFEANADLVGARNILSAGHAVIACGGSAQSGHPMKQEPAEGLALAIA